MLLASFVLGPYVQELLFNVFNVRVFAIFVLLCAGIMAPFVLEIIAVVSTSAWLRLLSWSMLPYALTMNIMAFFYQLAWKPWFFPIYSSFLAAYAPLVIVRTSFTIVYAALMGGFPAAVNVATTRWLHRYFENNLSSITLPSYEILRKRRIVFISFYWPIALTVASIF